MNQVWLSSLGGEIRGAYLSGGWIAEFFYHHDQYPVLKDRIYAGRVIDHVKSLNRAIINIGEKRAAFIEAKHIKALPHVGEKIMVQITAYGDPVSLSDHQLLKATRNISFYRCGLVYCPFKDLSSSLKHPTTFSETQRTLVETLYKQGFKGIVRSLSIQYPAHFILQVFQEMQSVWQEVEHAFINSSEPCLLHSPHPLHRWLERLENVQEIYFDAPCLTSALKNFAPTMPLSAPLLVPSKISYCGFPSEIEEAWQTLFHDEVPLIKTHGSIIIHSLPTCHVIDVNSASAQTMHNAEQTHLSVNMEAAEESARQIRLRGLKGNILIDFISMKTPHHRKLLEQKLKSLCKKDPYKLCFHGLSEMGLGELTREGIMAPLTHLISTPYHRSKSLNIWATELIRACYNASLGPHITVSLSKKLWDHLQTYHQDQWNQVASRFASLHINAEYDQDNMYHIQNQ